MTRAPGGPLFAVSDGAHQGNPDFFFLPPLFKNPSTSPQFEPAAFNARLRPVVEICELGAPAGDETRECIAGPLIKRFGPEAVSLGDQHYHVNWHTNESALNVGRFYRIQVFVGTELLGFADVDPVSTGKDLKNVQTGEYIGLVDGRTLPIKFRIEDGALCGEDGTACAAATINLAQGGGIELHAAGEEFRLDIPAGTEATSNGQAVTDVTFNLEVCDGIDVDLPRFGDCLRVTTFFDVAGEASELELTNAALISLCVLQPIGATEDQERLITLHQQDGDLIQALPHADPNCEVIGARATGLPGLAGRGWSWLRSAVGNLVTPRTLYAASRTAVFDLGGGGETKRFGSSCEPAGSARQSSPRGLFLVECPPSVAPQLAATAGPAAARTVSDFQFALPSQINFENGPDLGDHAPGADVTASVKITDVLGGPVANATVRFNHIPPSEGNGGVASSSEQCTTGDSDDLVCTTDASGIIEVQWTLSDEEGRNLLSAGGRGFGIHADQDGNGPFDSCLPDGMEGGHVHCSGTEAVFLQLNRGVIFFFADGVTPVGITFETYPNGTAACSRCDVTDQFRAQGVEFAYESFDNVFTGGTLGDGHGVLYGDGENLSNHFVTAALTEGGAGISGHLTMSLQPAYPKTVRFDLSTARDVTPPMNVFDGNGDLVPAAQITRTFLRNYTTSGAGAAASWTTVEITSATGIQRVVFVMTSFIQQIDNVVLTP